MMAVVAALLLGAGRSSAGEDVATRECELGIIEALSGQSAKAESIFISALSHAPGSPAALTNLGNLNLLRGDAEVALGFYERALAHDTSDAGIVLDQATALLVLGDEDAAQERAHLGVEMAGGMLHAAALLGLRAPAREGRATRGAEASYLSKEEVLSMLRAAAGRVPADSSRAAGRSNRLDAPGRRIPQWRPAGPRSTDVGVQPMLVYWKR